jgi:hypothetical protein
MLTHHRDALNRILDSRAAGINHRDIYGYDEEKDLAILGELFIATIPIVQKVSNLDPYEPVPFSVLQEIDDYMIP